MKVLVTGDRFWDDPDPIEDALQYLGPFVTVIHGNCKGADKLAEKAAANLHLPVIACPADWKRFGRGAGPKRNAYMIDNLQPDLVLAFHPDLESSKGTKDCVDKALYAEIPVVYIRGRE